MAKTETPASPPSDSAAAPSLIRMVRGSEYPEPHTADVHPDEVANFAAADWVVAD